MILILIYIIKIIFFQNEFHKISVACYYIKNNSKTFISKIEHKFFCSIKICIYIKTTSKILLYFENTLELFSKNKIENSRETEL